MPKPNQNHQDQIKQSLLQAIPQGADYRAIVRALKELRREHQAIVTALDETLEAIRRIAPGAFE